jgi:hypothetical protein
MRKLAREELINLHIEGWRSDDVELKWKLDDYCHENNIDVLELYKEVEEEIFKRFP